MHNENDHLDCAGGSADRRGEVDIHGAGSCDEQTRILAGGAVKEPGHYSTHCQPMVRTYARFLRESGAADEAVYVEALADSVLEAPKFLLNGYEVFSGLLNDRAWVTTAKEFRLPYPRLVLETQVRMNTAPGNAACDKVIVYLQQDENNGDIIVASISHLETPDDGWVWVPCWVAAKVRGHFNPVDDRIVPRAAMGGDIMVPHVSFDVSAVLHRKDASKLGVPKKELEGMMAQDIMTEMQTTWAFLWALDQRRATIEVSEPSAKLNKKRVANGALPFDSYHVLTLHASPPKDHATGKSSTQTLIDRMRPREHTRSGHWRHYKSGKKRWIKEMTINAGIGGIVWKDYRIGMDLSQHVDKSVKSTVE